MASKLRVLTLILARYIASHDQKYLMAMDPDLDRQAYTRGCSFELRKGQVVLSFKQGGQKIDLGCVTDTLFFMGMLRGMLMADEISGIDTDKLAPDTVLAAWKLQKKYGCVFFIARGLAARVPWPRSPCRSHAGMTFWTRQRRRRPRRRRRTRRRRQRLLQEGFLKPSLQPFGGRAASP